MSAQGNYISPETAGEAIGEFRAVTISSGEVIMSDAVTERVYGVSYRSAASGEEIGIVTAGTCFCRVDGSGTAIAKGDVLTPSATDGVLVKNAGTATHVPCAIALEAASEATTILVQLTPGLAANA